MKTRWSMIIAAAPAAPAAILALGHQDVDDIGDVSAKAWPGRGI